VCLGASWIGDPEMSVNYKKAREKITMDLLSRQRGADGEDPTLIILLLRIVLLLLMMRLVI
jgi:hypothetical protein